MSLNVIYLEMQITDIRESQTAKQFAYRMWLVDELVSCCYANATDHSDGQERKYLLGHREPGKTVSTESDDCCVTQYKKTGAAPKTRFCNFDNVSSSAVRPSPASQSRIGTMLITKTVGSNHHTPP
jgi:hypothetical protein